MSEQQSMKPKTMPGQDRTPSLRETLSFAEEFRTHLKNVVPSEVPFFSTISSLLTPSATKRGIGAHTIDMGPILCVYADHRYSGILSIKVPPTFKGTPVEIIYFNDKRRP
jgi:hypothetical protein